MKLLPASLYGRLLALGALATLAALAIAAVAIGAVLQRSAVESLDQRLDGEIALLASAVSQDGTVDRTRLVAAPPFDQPDLGWRWAVTLPDGTRFGNASLPAASPRPLPPPPPPEADGPPLPPPPADERPVDWRDPATGRVHGRVRTIDTAAGAVTIVATAPRALIERPLRAAMTPLLISLLLLGIALTVATLIQLRIGLAPLGRLRTALAEVRAGRADHIPVDQPSELAPMTRELNALIDENRAALTAARGATANLAHGLKTPLATLALELAEPGRDPDGRLTAQVTRLDAAVRHHLGRARAAATASPTRLATPLNPVLVDLAETLARIHADRPIAFSHEVPLDLAVAIDRHDLDDLLGTLLDNAWRWANRKIAATAATDEDAARVTLTIADDGPGIHEAARAWALEPGNRLDEQGDGHGFGLAIARDLAQLYGGSVSLDATPDGGLSARVVMPLARS